MMKAHLVYARETQQSIQRFYQLHQPLILSDLRTVEELMVSELRRPTAASVHVYAVHDEGISWDPLGMMVGLGSELLGRETLDAVLLQQLGIEIREKVSIVETSKVAPHPTTQARRRHLSGGLAASLSAITFPIAKLLGSARV